MQTENTTKQSTPKPTTIETAELPSGLLKATVEFILSIKGIFPKEFNYVISQEAKASSLALLREVSEQVKKMKKRKHKTNGMRGEQYNEENMEYGRPGDGYNQAIKDFETLIKKYGGSNGEL